MSRLHLPDQTLKIEYAPYTQAAVDTVPHTHGRTENGRKRNEKHMVETCIPNGMAAQGSTCAERPHRIYFRTVIAHGQGKLPEIFLIHQAVALEPEQHYLPPPFRIAGSKAAFVRQAEFFLPVFQRLIGLRRGDFAGGNPDRIMMAPHRPAQG